MFLPDGRVLIMDSELYKQTIEKSIVLDLFDGTSLALQQQALPLSPQNEEEKASSSTQRSANQRQPNTSVPTSNIVLENNENEAAAAI